MIRHPYTRRPQPQVPRYRMNEFIRANEVRLIDPEGKQVGVVALAEALASAKEAELDLVEVAPNEVPPVCRIIDYGKFLYAQRKKERQSKGQGGEIKSIRLSFNIGEHDLAVKLAKAKEFLTEGHKVKFDLHLRGREHAHTNLAFALLKRVTEELTESAMIESQPKKLGNFVSMLMKRK